MSPICNKHVVPLLLMWVFTIITSSTLAQIDGESELKRLEWILHHHMSTKTIYPHPNASVVNDDNDTANCQPVQLNYVIRHGTRYPTIKDINRIRKTFTKLKEQRASTSALSWVPGWKNPYSPKHEGELAMAGAIELNLIGQRLRARFGKTFAPYFNTQHYVFEHTYKIRTKQSASAFAYGFFNGRQPVSYVSYPIGADEKLRFFDNCPAFDRQVDKNKTATIEHSKYRHSKQMEKNLKRFQLLAGDNPKLTLKDMEAAYAACAFDVAVGGQPHHWCALFDAEMLMSFDYFNDLKHFYKRSHGNAIAFEIAAPLFQDMYQSMHAYTTKQSQVQGHFRFAHAETILPLASLLNLSSFDQYEHDRDVHFLSETPMTISDQRSFRGSLLAPFAGNIGFVLHECRGPLPSSVVSYRVQTLLHEQTIRFPDCDHQQLCPFPQFEQMFWKWIHTYDFKKQCALWKVGGLFGWLSKKV